MGTTLPLKKPTTFEEQIERLRIHGFVVECEEEASCFLRNVNYYRLSAYFLPFRENAELIPFDKVISAYKFDSSLRLWVLAVIEDIEQYAKTQIAYHLAHKYGSEAHLNEDIFSKNHNHDKFLEKINWYYSENKKDPVFKHHKSKYKGHMPIWVIIDFFTLGSLSIMYADLNLTDKKQIAMNSFLTGRKQLESWLRVLTELRNRCAHFARLYYWLFLSTPKNDIRFENTWKMDNTLFSQIFMLKLLHQNQYQWDRHLKNLFSLIDEFDGKIDLAHIGFKPNWKELLKSKL